MHGFIQTDGGVTLSNRVLQILRELGNTVFTVGAFQLDSVQMTKAIFKPRCAGVPRADPLAGRTPALREASFGGGIRSYTFARPILPRLSLFTGQNR
jgi:hypothetical protein